MNDPNKSGYSYRYDEITTLGDVIFFRVYLGSDFPFVGGWGTCVIDSYLNMMIIGWYEVFFVFADIIVAAPHVE